MLTTTKTPHLSPLLHRSNPVEKAAVSHSFQLPFRSRGYWLRFRDFVEKPILEAGYTWHMAGYENDWIYTYTNLPSWNGYQKYVHISHLVMKYDTKKKKTCIRNGKNHSIITNHTFLLFDSPQMWVLFNDPWITHVLPLGWFFHLSIDPGSPRLRRRWRSPRDEMEPREVLKRWCYPVWWGGFFLRNDHDDDDDDDDDIKHQM